MERPSWDLRALHWYLLRLGSGFLPPSIPNHISNVCGNAHVPMRFTLYELTFSTVEEKAIWMPCGGWDQQWEQTPLGHAKTSCFQTFFEHRNE